MKDLSVLKKHLTLYSLLLSSLLAEGELQNILSLDRNELINQQITQSEIKKKELERSWINPIILQYSKNYTTQFGDTLNTQQFIVSVDQPIFKMGGIWSAIKYAKALGEANSIDIELKRREAISKAITILYNLKKSKYQIDRLNLIILNDTIDIEIERENYENGLTNRTLYDQALLKKNQDSTSKLELELTITKLEGDFAILSDKDPYSLTLPTFSMISQERYLSKELELKRDILRVEEKRENKFMTLTKYLPEVSITGRYINEDLNPLFSQPNSSINREYFNYGFKVTLPISVNSLDDIQNSKIEYLSSKIALKEKRREILNNYLLIEKRLAIIDKKIELSKDDELHYNSMLFTQRELEEIGDKTSFDTQKVENTLKIRKIDQEIYEVDAQLELLKLYVNVSDAL